MSLLLFFEVMDKEFSIESIFLYFLLLGFGGFWLTRWNPVLLLIPYICVLFSSFAILEELNDPYVGPAIVSEAGYSYVILTYVSIVVGLILPLAGIPAWLIRYRRNRPLQ